ncbi:acyl-CoA thioesterase [Candidatus Sumerlaeota bacterium]|nr:acyl-CoA thioesterase [Candidatus Sumerlaeota bacterium]
MAEKLWNGIHNDHIVRVTYRDTDRMGYAYYANYLVWFEMGRAELLRQSGHTYDEFEEQGYILPVVRCVCEYRKPARYDDLIRIRTKISRMTPVTIIFEYEISGEKTGEILARGETKHAILTREGRIARAGKILEEWFKE